MRTLMSKPLTLLTRNLTSLVMVMLLVTSCGSDNNVKKDDLGSGSGSASSGYTTGVWDASIESAISPYRSSISCTFGGSRTTTVSYYINDPNGLGVYTAGYSGGYTGSIYLGRSIFGDIMAVQELTSGSTITGYNVYLEMCDFTSNGVPLIGGGRTITNLGIDTMYTATSSSCSHDIILKSSVWLEVGDYEYYPATSFPTAFFPIDTDVYTGYSQCNSGSYSYWNPYSNYY
ncbi:MAG: hypothetical protein HOE90_20545 [Bacteriovoracaceae bacterium]|jgi:hypothetical protein|nr:hypothetical protein [Bacteriovoracaceae bacterium]